MLLSGNVENRPRPPIDTPLTGAVLGGSGDSRCLELTRPEGNFPGRLVELTIRFQLRGALIGELEVSD
ncbi:MAG TPA: hypothetical protein VNE17_06055 [Nitrolancea sp.]|nr:hypothetical protein [Nitrolancea sp.]